MFRTLLLRKLRLPLPVWRVCCSESCLSHYPDLQSYEVDEMMEIGLWSSIPRLRLMVIANEFRLVSAMGECISRISHDLGTPVLSVAELTIIIA